MDPRGRFPPCTETFDRGGAADGVVAAVAKFNGLSVHPEPEFETGSPFVTGRHDNVQPGEARSHLGLWREGHVEAAGHLAILV